MNKPKLVNKVHENENLFKPVFKLIIYNDFMRKISA